MVKDQLLCIVTPDAPAPWPASVQRRLQRACEAAGCIHYATIALLPPLPGGAPAGTSLLFELVLDEGMGAQASIDLLLQHGFAALWQLYRNAWDGPRQAGPAAKKAWLREHLFRHASVPAGGFIGLRDRRVAQVRAEATLVERARRQLPLLRQGDDDTSAALARRVVAWAQGHGFGWATEPSPRSFWRERNVAPWRRGLRLSLRLFIPALAVLGGLMLLGWLAAQWFGLIQLPRGFASAAGLGALALLAFGVLVALLAVSGVLAVTVALGLLILFVAGVLVYVLISLLSPDAWAFLIFAALGLLALVAVAVVAAWQAIAAALLAMRVPPFAPALAAALALVALFGIGLVLTEGVFALLARLPETRRALPAAPRGLAESAAWTAGALAVVALVLWLLERLWRWLMPWLAGVARRFDHPPPQPAAPLVAPHQVHPSVLACEAALAGQTNHMISLTEVRTPLWWHGRWLRFWLWFIRLLGEVLFTEGRLGRADGIKFAHWHVLDGGRRLVFVSNYDGSFGGYLDEFIHGASQGVNLIWNCTLLMVRAAAREGQPEVRRERRFPPVRLWIFRGCTHEQAFKAYARDSMLPHRFRYEAYAGNCRDIQRATRLRDALSGPRNTAKDDQLMRALES